MPKSEEKNQKPAEMFVCPWREITKPEEIEKYLRELDEGLRIPSTLVGSEALSEHIPWDEKRGKKITKADCDLIVDAKVAHELWMECVKDQASFRGAKLTIFELPEELGKKETPGAVEEKGPLIFHHHLYLNRFPVSWDLEIVTSKRQSGYLVAMYPSSTKVYVVPFRKVQLAEVEILEALKSAHIYHPNKFGANISDLHLLRRLLKIQKVCGESQESFTLEQRAYLANSDEVGPEPERSVGLTNLLQLRRREVNARKGVPGEKVNLKMGNEEFLEGEGNLVVQKFCAHDTIHQKVAFGEQPLYMKLKEDQSQASCVKGLWEKMSLEEKRQNTQEEAMVLALERYLLPGYFSDAQQAYFCALTRIATSLSKGWFRKFAVDHFPALQGCPKPLGQIAHQIIRDYYQRSKVEKKAVEPQEEEPQIVYRFASLPEQPASETLFKLLEEVDPTTLLTIVHPKGKGKIAQWKNSHFHEYSLTDANYYRGRNYGNHPSSFEVYRVFHIGASKYSREVYIKVYTNHELTVHDCCESVYWEGKVVITATGRTLETSKERLQASSYRLESQKELPHYLDLEIRCGCSGGTSHYNGNYLDVGVKNVPGEVPISLLLRILLSRVNPSMLPGGEQLLAKVLSEKRQKSFFSEIPGRQHNWFHTWERGPFSSRF